MDIEARLFKIINSDLSTVSLTDKEFVFHQAVAAFAKEYDFNPELILDPHINFREAHARRQRGRYFSIISKKNLLYDDLYELYIVLHELFHELVHNRQDFYFDQGMDSPTMRAYAIEYGIGALDKTSRYRRMSEELANLEPIERVYDDNHDYFLYEIHANIEGYQRAYAFLCEYVGEKVLSEIGLASRHKGDLAHQERRMAMHHFRFKGQEFRGSYEENVAALLAVCEEDSPVIGSFVTLYNNKLDKKNNHLNQTA